ncbi:type II toxin-antitoxin system HicA family toxin [Candidatus Woesearchaeota archaeon]|nr:type II toxin-antitoxin system HicA family toxin [Candidatus Woesearchaeota archaeon]
MGFLPVRQKGSHIILTKLTSEGKKAVVVPNHSEIDRGTLLEIIRQAGLKKEEFLDLIS